MAFDKSGDYIASGALGGSLYVWSVKDGTIVRSFRESSSLLYLFLRPACYDARKCIFSLPFPDPLIPCPPHHRGGWGHFRDWMGPARGAAGGVLLDGEGGGAGLPQNVVRRACGGEGGVWGVWGAGCGDGGWNGIGKWGVNCRSVMTTRNGLHKTTTNDVNLLGDGDECCKREQRKGT